MAPKSSDSSQGLNESVKQILKLLEYVDGTVDFGRFARDHGVPTVEAARKRFKRHFAANNLNVTTTGDRIGNGLVVSGSTTLNRATKRKNADETADIDDETPMANKKKPRSTKKTKSANKIATEKDTVTDGDGTIDGVDGE